MLNELIRSNIPAIFVKTQEEYRIDEVLAEAITGSVHKKGMLVWYPNSLQAYNPDEDSFMESSGIRDIKDRLDMDVMVNLLKSKGCCRPHNLFVFHGFKYFVSPSHNSLSHDTIYKVMSLVLRAKETGDTIILVGNSLFLPPELSSMFYVYEHPLPKAEAIADVFKSVALEYSTDKGDRSILPVLMRDIPKAANTAQGLTLMEAENAFFRSLITTGGVDIPLLMHHKAAKVAQSDVLELLDVSGCSIDRVIGFDAYKQWLASRKVYFTQKPNKLPSPKGCLLIGMAGVGKSIIAKATGNFLGLPTIRFDFSRVLRPFVGESEEILEHALKMLESIAPCSVFLDEINMSMSGTEGSTVNDSGVMMKLMQMFLTWRQERGKDVFIVATGNTLETLPPMLYRPGRFDQIYFCDLPTAESRERMFRLYLSDYDIGCFLDDKEIAVLAAKTKGFSGAEIEHTVINALYMAAAESVEVSFKYLSTAVGQIRPVSNHHSDTIQRMLHSMRTAGVLNVETGEMVS